jgi:hypothetical protein
VENAWNTNLHPGTLHTLQDMLFRSHPGVHLYKQACELTSAMPPDQQCQIAFCFDSGCDRCCYQAPHTSVREIAVNIPGDGDQVTGAQDIILYRNHSLLLSRTTSNSSGSIKTSCVLRSTRGWQTQWPLMLMPAWISWA